ncbi:thymocyte nuclear protein 1 [Conidiobolus coronatus NRRL 28638]|uniref:Thymocyte nuclear protein 1 n=1 Tax=Conidiobolus coronatus (strain ATCC 28846 / CBS 209.66 / NRRL 28638) TaxID=796925 RepID=A0A137P6Z0_CONC2|nr:thymocyte nuclear protein 1 [Conidiobolus coronatus NRRL 28638]|eukprot:KXN70783.1 thymocyte nuclear protein 1 [Conidiobolus coronatus NRRL 28638]
MTVKKLDIKNQLSKKIDNQLKKANKKQSKLSQLPALLKSLDEPISCWLMKAEPDTRIVKGKDVKFSIDDLISSEDQTTSWEGVRNFEARNFLQNYIKQDHQVLFYHSNCKTPGIAGLAKVVKEGYPDESAFDAKHPYYDAKSESENPKWFAVDVQFVRKFDNLISLKSLKEYQKEYKALNNMVLFSRAQLSVQPVTQSQLEAILEIEGKQKE